MLPSLLISALLALPAQQSAPDPREAAAAQANRQGDALHHVNELLERGDTKAAEPELAKLAAADPKNAQLLYDLGFCQERNGEDEAAARSYRAAVAADAASAEPRVALGLLLARGGEVADARAALQAAAKLASVPSALHARALRALARLDQQPAPEQARAELAEAIQLTGEQPGDPDLTAALVAKSGNAADAEATYRRALAENPADLAVTVELASLLERQNKLAEADALLLPALAVHPDDPRLVAQTATLYAAEGKNSEALQLLKTLRDSDPQAAQNASLTRLYAHLLLVSGDAAAAEPLYRGLVDANAGDPTLLDELGSVLVREQKFDSAEAVLTKAVAQREAFHDDGAWGEAAGHLAFAASRNHHPEVALQALHARATVLPNSPATLFLQATAQDTLHRRKEAEQLYRAFLAMANGKLPDEEFEARHRLIALEHEH